jgi:hypothetical protein
MPEMTDDQIFWAAAPRCFEKRGWMDVREAVS